MPIWLQLVGMLLTGSLLTTVVNVVANRKRSNADISKIFAETAGTLVEQSNVQMQGIQSQLTEVKKENAGFICEIGRLEGLIKRLEIEIREKNIEAETMRDEIRSLRSELAEKDREIEALESENKQLKERVSELERKLAAFLNSPYPTSD